MSEYDINCLICVTARVSSQCLPIDNDSSVDSKEAENISH